jgi:hypothetical protein
MMIDIAALNFVSGNPFYMTGSVDAAQLAINPLMPEDIAAISEMTFPAFRPLLAPCLAGEAHDGCGVFARVARDGGIPVGLVLAQTPLAAAADGGDADARMAAARKTVGNLSLACARDDPAAVDGADCQRDECAVAGRPP